MTHFTSVLVSVRNWFSVRFFGILVVFLGLSVSEGWGQTTVTIGGGASITCPAVPTATWTTPPTGVTFSNWSRGSGVTCGSASTALSGSGFNTASANASFTANKYYSVTITADATHTFTLNSIVWSTAVSSGNCTFDVQYSNNGGSVTSFGTTGQTNTSSNTFSGNVSVAAGTSIVLYLIPSGTDATGRTVRWVNSSTITITASAAGSTPPILNAASNPTVDGAFDVTFTDDAASQTWVSTGGTAVTVGGTALTAGYAISNGKITFTPSASVPAGLLQTAGASKAIVISKTGYSNATVSQTIGVGAASKLGIKTQPTAPTYNGLTFATQPAVYIQDQYGNTTSSNASVLAAVGAGVWTLGGTSSVVGVNGTATFSGLTATCSESVTGATITFSSSGLTSVTSSAVDLSALVSPPSVPTALTFGSITYNGFTASFTAPGTAPTGYLVLRRAVTAVSGAPVGGTVYTQGQTNIGSGTNEVVYVGSSVWNAYAQSGLTDNTNYYYAVYSYNGSGATINYSSALTGSQTTTSISATTSNAATAISSTGFTANWSAISGAAEYKLDVSNYAAFGTNTVNPAQTIVNNTGTIGQSGWSETTISQQGGGSPYLGLLSSGSKLITPSIDFSVLANSKLNFKIRTFGGTSGTSNIITTSISIDNGSSWIQLGTRTVSSTTLTAVSEFDLSSYTQSQVKIRFESLGATGSIGLGVDDITIVADQTVFTSSFVGIFNDLPATGISRNITGLSPNTTYYYRVRAVGGNSTSTNSNVISVTTLASYAIGASSSNGAMGSVSGANSYDDGANVSLTATPASASYRFVNWTENGSFVSKETTYTFTASAARTLVANFADMTAPIAITTSTNASTYAACTTCDVTVANGVVLTIDESKQFNSVTVAAGGKLTLTDGAALTSPISLQSTADGTATFVDESTGTAQNITGSVQQYLATTRNWYVSSPVNNAIAPAGYTYYRRNEPTVNWAPITAGTELVAGVGYIALPNSTGPITFSTESGGRINTGNIDISLSWQGASSKGYNLIGNPYPSHLTWNKAFTDANASKIEPSIWYRTNSGSSNSSGWSFKTYNAFTGVGVPVGTTGIIPPMQAFWVLAKADAQSIQFTNSMRSHQSSNPLKARTTDTSIENKLIRLQVSNATASDETVLLFNANASDSYDVFDSPKMLNNDSNVPDIFTVIDSKKLVINGMHDVKYNIEIPLGFITNKTADFKISTTEMSNFDASTRIVLKDANSTVEYDITNGNSYEFSSTPTNTINRFSVIFRTSGLVNGFDNRKLDTSTSVFVNANGELVVKTSALLSADAKVAVFNAIGQQISLQPITSGMSITNVAHTAGIYWVKLTSDGESITRKVVIK